MTDENNENEEHYYQIGEASKICNIPVRTLHYYDDIGLLKPIKINPESNYRYYSQEQLFHINIIKNFKVSGFTLKEVEQLLVRDNIDYNQGMLNSKCAEIDQTISNLMILKKRLQLYVQGMQHRKQDLPGEIDIQLKEIPPSIVAYSRYNAPCNPDAFIVRYSKLYNIVEKNHLHMTGTLMAIFYDDYRNFDYTNADIEVCVAVAEQEELQGMVRKFGGFTAVVGTHYGSYKTTSNTYKKILDWIEKSGYTFEGAAIENYIVDAGNTIYEENYITELILPVKKNT